jgi:hypothetical protein
MRREPVVDLAVEIGVFADHGIVLDELPAHAENALGIHGVGGEFLSLDADVFEVHHGAVSSFGVAGRGTLSYLFF